MTTEVEDAIKRFNRANEWRTGGSSDLGVKRRERQVVKPDTVCEIIKQHGGLVWLMDMEPLTLFAFLKAECRGLARLLKFVLDSNEGWFLFVEDDGPETKKVIGFFYKRGRWPVSYTGTLKYSEYDCWYLSDVLSALHDDPRITDFTNVVYCLEKEWR